MNNIEAYRVAQINVVMIENAKQALHPLKVLTYLVCFQVLCGFSECCILIIRSTIVRCTAKENPSQLM